MMRSYSLRSRYLGVHRLHGPAAKVVVNVPGSDVEICLGYVEAQNTIAHQAGAGDNHSQNLLIGETREVDMLERILGTGSRDSHTNIAGDQREHMRGPLHKFLSVANAVEGVLNDGLIFVRKVRFSRELLNVVAIGFGSRYATS
jgi:hypothetical protein